MKGTIRVALLLLLATLLAPATLPAANVIDGIAATVNGTAILQSDVEEAIRCEALLEGRPLAAVTAPMEQEVLQRLIDQELLRQQLPATFPAVKPEDLAQRILHLQQQLPEVQGGIGLARPARPLWSQPGGTGGTRRHTDAAGGVCGQPLA